MSKRHGEAVMMMQGQFSLKSWPFSFSPCHQNQSSTVLHFISWLLHTSARPSPSRWSAWRPGWTTPVGSKSTGRWTLRRMTALMCLRNSVPQSSLTPGRESSARRFMFLQKPGLQVWKCPVCWVMESWGSGRPSAAGQMRSNVSHCLRLWNSQQHSLKAFSASFIWKTKGSRHTVQVSVISHTLVSACLACGRNKTNPHSCF